MGRRQCHYQALSAVVFLKTRVFWYSRCLNCIKYNERGQQGWLWFLPREIFALQRNMLQMRLVTIPFRSPFRPRATSLWQFCRSVFSSPFGAPSALVAGATNIFSALCYHTNVENLNRTRKKIAPSFFSRETQPWARREEG